jgi:hypothetical protein
LSYQLDHIAVVCADLATGAAWLSDQLGVSLVDGGVHLRFGTHNKLLGLADGLYLEVIAPDPDLKMDRPRWFDLDAAPLAPAWGNWICRADDLVTRADLTGPALQMTRGDLRWEITVPEDGSLPMGGGFPTLIKWADAGHPATRLPNSGCRLLKWEIQHPDAARLDQICDVTDLSVKFVRADKIGFSATFETPSGIRTVS